MLPVAKEFRAVFVLSTLLLIGVQLSAGSQATLLWLPWLVFLFFIRDSRYEIPPIPLANIAPVDGKVMQVIKTQDPFLNRPALRYSIAQSKWGEFNLHSPIEGKVEQLWVQDPQQDKCLAFWIRTDEQDDVVVQVELSSLFQHGSTDMHPGERIGQGKRCGFVAVGCKVHLYLPVEIEQIAQMRQRVIAGKHIIANFIRKS